MNTTPAQRDVRVLTVTALIAAVVGGAFYWWVPLGIVASLAGLMIGFADWTRARSRSLDSRLSVLAMALAVVVLAVDIAVALLHLQTITFGQ